MIRTLVQDARHAARGLIHTRGFTLTAAATLAVGIAAATAMFSLFDAVLLRPLPFRDPDRLVALHERRNGIGGGALSGHELLAWRDGNQVFEGVAGFMYSSFTLTGNGEPQVVQALAVSANYFDVLGLRPQAGRGFVAGEDQAGATHRVVLSDRLWRQRFGGSAAAVSRSILLDNEPHLIVGVMASGGVMDPDIWVPADIPLQIRRVGRHSMFAVARLRDGVTTRRAQDDLEVISKRLERELPDFNTGHGAEVVRLGDELLGSAKQPIRVAAGAVGFVLLIACANVAHLLLTRGAARQKEIAIRAALGASRARLVRYLLIESTMLALASGAVGALVATWIIDLLPAVTAVDIPRLGDTAMNARVLVVCVIVSMLAGILCGTVPALRGSRAMVSSAVADGARGSAAVPARLTGLLAISEVALAMVLLIGAALMGQSLLRLSRVDPGFDPDNVLTLPVALPGTRYATPMERVRFFETLAERIGNGPAGRASAGVSHLPLSPGDNRTAFEIEHRPPARRGEELRASLRVVAGDYFAVMGIPLERGRTFVPADARRSLPLIRWFEQQPLPQGFDQPQAPPVALINETLARRFWPGADPVGRRIRVLFSPWITIVGVVGDVRHAGLAASPVPEIYLSHTQEPQAALTVLVRTADDPARTAAALRDAVRTLDRDLPLTRVRAMTEVLQLSLGRPRFDAFLLGTFSAVALLLAMIGIYGVTSYGVGQRRREIGIRAALGATPRDVLRLVLARGIGLTLAGVAAGLAGAYALTRVLSTLLYGIAPHDFRTYAAAALALAAISLVATYIPARRALSVDPVTALRME